MSSSSVARRYARALMSLGVDDGRFEQYGTQLSSVEQAFEASPELRDLWLNPANDHAHRLAALDQLAVAFSLSPAVVNVIRLLLGRGRIHDLALIVRAYGELVDEQIGRIRAVVTTAVPVSEATRASIGKALAEMTQRQVVMQTNVDPKLIGGVVAQVGSTLIDGSLRTQLDQLRENMRTAAL